MESYTFGILFGVVVGTLSRIYMMRTDYRQYPTYLHGKIIHIALGFIASGLGAIMIPAIMEKNYTAITFLTVAASQFRDVRNMERTTLTELDHYELVSRGKTYIEGIAIAFESRNYLVIFTAFVVTATYLFTNWYWTLLVTVLALLICKLCMSGKKLRDICDIQVIEPRFEGVGLYIDNIYIMNIGHPARQEEVLQQGMGFMITPKNFNASNTIANLGQRQAILYDTANSLGIYRDSGTPALTPLIKRDLANGRIGVFILPQLKDEKIAIEVIGAVPILENAVRMPSKRLKKGISKN